MFRFVVGGKCSSRLQQLPHGCGSHVVSCSVATAGFILGVTLPDRDASHLPPPENEGQVWGQLYFRSPIFFHGTQEESLAFMVRVHLVSAVAHWLRRYDTNRKVAGSIPNGVI
jgi:hypothetical protein